MRRAFLFLIGIALGTMPAAASVEWSQSGGSMVSSPTGSGIVGQGYETIVSQGGGLRLQSGFLAHRIFHINKPFVVADIPDRKMSPGNPPIRIALADMFAELDGDSLRFEPSIQGASVSAMVVRDSLVLSCAAGSFGLTTIFVRAVDGDGSATTSFEVDVQPSTAVTRRTPTLQLDKTLGVRVHGAFAPAAMGSSPGFLGRGVRSGESNESRLGIDVLLPGATRISVSIFDNMGVPVISWSEDISAADLFHVASEADGRKPLSVVWNLRTPAGSPVPSGVYLWQIEAKAANGAELKTVRRLGVKKP